MKKILICTCLMFMATLMAQATEICGGGVQPPEYDVGYVMPDITIIDNPVTVFNFQDAQAIFIAPMECWLPAQVVTDVATEVTETEIRLTLVYFTWPNTSDMKMNLTHRARAQLGSNYMDFRHRSATA